MRKFRNTLGKEGDQNKGIASPVTEWRKSWKLVSVVCKMLSEVILDLRHVNMTNNLKIRNDKSLVYYDACSLVNRQIVEL